MDPAVSCAACGAAAPSSTEEGAAALLGWMREVDGERGTTWVCPTCVRDHTRAIEARLDQRWW